MIAALLARWIGVEASRWFAPLAIVGALGLAGGGIYVAGLTEAARLYDRGHAAGRTELQAELDAAARATQERIDNALRSIGEMDDDVGVLRDHVDGLRAR